MPWRRTVLARLYEPGPGATFKDFFNFPDDAAALVSSNGTLQPLPDDANKKMKEIYAANAKGGVAKLQPAMLTLWQEHQREPRNSA